MHYAQYQRPQWGDPGSTTAPVYSPGPAAPAWYDRVSPWVLVAFLGGLVLGMFLMRWQHRS